MAGAKFSAIGYLTRDTEFRQTATGRSQVRFRIGVSRRYRDATTKQRGTDYFDVVAWGPLADFCENFLVKGSRVVVHGVLENRPFTRRDGTEGSVLEVTADEVDHMNRPRTLELREDVEEICKLLGLPPEQVQQAQAIAEKMVNRTGNVAEPAESEKPTPPAVTTPELGEAAASAQSAFEDPLAVG